MKALVDVGKHIPATKISLMTFNVWYSCNFSLMDDYDFSDVEYCMLIGPGDIDLNMDSNGGKMIVCISDKRDVSYYSYGKLKHESFHGSPMYKGFGIRLFNS